MAVSPLYLISVTQMIERLHDPYKLSPGEERKLSEMLTLEESIEANGRRSRYEFEAYARMEELNFFYPHIKDIDDDGWTEFVTALNLCLMEGPRVAANAEALWADVALARSMNYRDKSILADAIDKAQRKQEHLDSYLLSVFKAFDKLKEPCSLYVEHRGERTIHNVPRPVEKWDNVYWPDEPNSFRRAHIEVLTEKLERLQGHPIIV